jgi:alpha-L-arabinofuranosidase
MGVCAALSPAQAQVSVSLDAANRGPAIGNLHYGIFFEEINHAGDGGLYAELIRNRSFEDSSSADYWSKVGNATLSIITGNLINDAQARALKVTFAAAGDGISNTGYWGIKTEAGTTYDLSFWVQGDYNGTLTASLVDDNGTSLGSVAIPVTAGKEWKKVTATLTATGTNATAKFRLTSSKAGSINLDVISLFPPTYKNRPNGCRKDLAEMLEAMHPGFMRFPGGCFVEGQASDAGRNRFEWKKTIGGIETRPGHWNQNWGYRASDGLGFHEMLQLAEDLGAEPLFVVNIGMGHSWSVNYLEIDEFIQEALDAIEYCNGDVNTTWGAVRAANGHPEPFNLRLLEIGNENYQADSSQQSDHYAERYRQFYDAIKAKYPEVTLIGNVEAWGTDSPSWRNSNPVEVVDEHYYRSPSWFQNQYSKYDNYDRSKPKVYVGEYAVTSDFGTNGHLTAALGEAIYMLGMENNSDVCVMNSYAPIFVNENDARWKPDMIRFTTTEAYGTPSYHVQKLMSDIHGKQNVKWTETGNIESTGHKIGVSTWSTAATFDNVKVTDANGNVVFTDDFSTDNGLWHSNGGTWAISNGALTQSDASMQGQIYYADVTTPDSYTYELDATKNSGAEAFLIAFNYGDGSNYCWWNIGGWSNTNHALEVCVNGSKSNYDQRSGSIETGRTYHVKIEVDGAAVKCYLDGTLIHDVTLPVTRNVYLASSVNDDEGVLYLKVVNPGATATTVNYTLANATITGVEDVTVLSSALGTDENSTDNQQNVYPTTGSLSDYTANTATYEAPAYSLSIIRLKVSGSTSGINPGAAPSAEAEAAVKEALDPTARKLAFLHASTSLPTTTSSGATIKWSLKGGNAALLSLSESNWATYLNVAAPLTNESAITGSTLVATVTYPAGETSQIEYPVTIAPTDGMYGYLYCYMKSTKEITNYALGTKADRGMKFSQLLNGDEIFDTNSCAAIEHGTRDAYLGRGHRDNEYFITTTDMSNATSGVWNNYGLDLIRSTDLIHWEGSSFDFRQGKQIFSDPNATTDAYKTDSEYANITRVWAPQWLWDETANNGQGAYLVYYSLLSTNSGDNHDKIYYSYADKDFKTLTQPRLFYDPGYSVIDADIVFDPYDNLYHMAIKHEGASGSDRGIYILTSPKLVGGTWTEVLHMTNDGSESVEGPSLIRLIDEDTYNLYYMRYSGGSAYKMCSLDHLTTNAGSSIAVDGDGNFQHGSFITVTEQEYNVLQLWSDLTAEIATAKAYNSSLYDKAIATAEAALANTTIAALAEELPKAKEALRQAHSEYVKSIIETSGSDLTSLLVNPDFNSYTGTGWNGVAFSATNQGVAEHYNRTFDTYQVLEGMPAGTYTFSCSGFYRNGSKSAYNNHVDGTEKLLAKLYANGDETSFMSLFDESTPYTYSPYTFPDNTTTANTAFNTGKYYADNSVSTVLSTVGDLTVGLRKTTAVSADWVCVDNFTLTYNPDITGSVITIADDNATLVDVYSTTGIRLRHNVDAASATAGLTPGIYIVGHRKVAVK